MDELGNDSSRSTVWTVAQEVRPTSLRLGVITQAITMSVRRRILVLRAIGVVLVLAAGTVLLLQLRVDS